MDNKENKGYQLPPKSIQDLADAPLTSGVSLSPSGNSLLILKKPGLPSIKQVSLPELRLAGIRINPKTNATSRVGYYIGLNFLDLDKNKLSTVKSLPRNLIIEYISWSPKGTKIAFTNSKARGLELWVVDVNSLKAKRITKDIVNATSTGSPFNWLDEEQLLLKTIPENRGPKPNHERIPLGPLIQENDGLSSPIRTYQDLLKNPIDEALFDYFTSNQIFKINVNTKKYSIFGNTGPIVSISISPDAKYALITSLQKPYSYLVPHARFPRLIEIWDIEKNKRIKELAHIPLAENIPQGFGAVRTGPRSISWRADKPNTLFWVEALDEGNPQKESEYRDQLYFLSAPFNKTTQSIRFKLRFGGIDWCDDELAVSYEWWWKNRQVVRSFFNPSKKDAPKKIIFNRSWENIYNAPGSFCTHYNKFGKRTILRTEKNQIFLVGEGASPQGNRPFLDQFDIKSHKIERLWRCEDNFYEKPLYLIDPQKISFLSSREAEKKPPNFYIRSLQPETLSQITHFDNPIKDLLNVKKKLITYSRNDGVKLSGTLYLPADFNADKDKPLPVLMWAYPKEFKSAEAAGQINESPHRFLRIYPHSPIFWATQGYAVLNDFSMPIIGEGEEEPNETFIEQLKGGAKAAIQKMIDMGVADPDRIAVGGHSYGAFMTANLLAHTDFFAAGIARSGAYNRTLTPFGFQSEERTLWQAADTYFKMSPFMSADKIKTPLLMIHGEADNNSGTYTMQSERFYAALKAHGASCRLVILPHESHGYRAKESIMHMLWEMHQWLEKYVKNKQVLALEKTSAK